MNRREDRVQLLDDTPVPLMKSLAVLTIWLLLTILSIQGAIHLIQAINSKNYDLANTIPLIAPLTAMCVHVIWLVRRSGTRDEANTPLRLS